MADMELDMVADMEVYKVADIKVGMVADINIATNINMEIQSRELINWAKTFLTRSFTRLAHLLSFARLFHQ